MWDPLLEPRLGLLHGRRRDLRDFAQELAHHSLHTRTGNVLWCDGDHGFDPYAFAEGNLVAGRDAADGADRLLVKRCMTPYQWDTVLTKQLQAKLLESPASMVLAAPYDRLFSTDEMQDWEQEDHVRHSLRHLKGLTRRHRVPILLSVDMERWWRTHPILAKATYEAAEAKWTVDRPGGHWRVRKEGAPAIEEPHRTLWDYEEEPVVPSPPARPPRPKERPQVIALREPKDHPKKR